MAHAGILKTHRELMEEALRHAVYLNERAMKAEGGDALTQIPIFGGFMCARRKDKILMKERN